MVGRSTGWPTGEAKREGEGYTQEDRRKQAAASAASTTVSGPSNSSGTDANADAHGYGNGHAHAHDVVSTDGVTAAWANTSGDTVTDPHFCTSPYGGREARADGKTISEAAL